MTGLVGGELAWDYDVWDNMWIWCEKHGYGM